VNKKFDWENLHLEEKDSDEIWNHSNEKLKIRNIYFDITPPDLLTGIITESGRITPENINKYIDLNKKVLSI
jgi:translation initiation factor 2B subunit (eIF-2B alpha/beta/delta family)